MIQKRAIISRIKNIELIEHYTKKLKSIYYIDCVCFAHDTSMFRHLPSPINAYANHNMFTCNVWLVFDSDPPNYQIYWNIT